MPLKKPDNWSDFDWLWVEMEEAWWAVHSIGSPPAWESPDPTVRAAWERITDPANRGELERRLNTTARRATERALAECLRRTAEQDAG